MKLGDKFIWVDSLDQTVDNEVLVYLGNDGLYHDGSYHYFALEWGKGTFWVGLEEEELDWIKPVGE